MSTSDAAREKIVTLVRDAVVAAHPGALVAYENVKFSQPKDRTPWVHIAIAPGKSKRRDIGETRQFRHTGVVIVNVMVAENTGTKTLVDITDTVFYALADRTYALGVYGYLRLCGAERRNRGVINGWATRNVQVEYMHDAPDPT